MLYINDIGGDAIRLHIKSWCDNPEQGAIDQAVNLANLPFAFKHIALMPDVHQGYGMPIGGVLATEDVVIVNAIGVDIGCGVAALKTKWKTDEVSKEKLLLIKAEIEKVIPTGFSRHQLENAERKHIMESIPLQGDCPVLEDHYNNAINSLGTLGSGNHFCEIQKDKDNFIWVMIHSGSRNLGYQIAKAYNAMAKEVNEQYYSVVNPKLDLAFLPIHSAVGMSYIREMEYCVEYARENRLLMMKNIMLSFKNILSEKYNFSLSGLIDVKHNYARIENHFGKNVMVHRKGAISARKGEIGVIPGSMGTSSYIVKGLGNKDSFNSASHGAGRKMSRTKAKEDLDIDSEKKILDSQGIIHSINTVDDLDEAPSAYKSIDIVMEEQKDLVSIEHKLTPLMVIKG